MHTLPTLSYQYDALEPHISREIMRLHHAEHHNAYVSKLNDALESVSPQLASLPLEQLLGRLDEVPEVVRLAVRNNGGGHYNHSLFWQVLSPQGGGAPSGQLQAGLEKRYGSFAAFKQEFTKEAASVFGSGWVWLQPDLSIIKSSNQDNPIMNGEAEPLMGLDVWEHAYYLDYKNVRPDYISAWWHVVDWQFIQDRYVR